MIEISSEKELMDLYNLVFKDYLDNCFNVHKDVYSLRRNWSLNRVFLKSLDDLLYWQDYSEYVNVIYLNTFINKFNKTTFAKPSMLKEKE